VTCGHVWAHYKLKICLKNKTKRGPKKGRCPLLKVLNFVNGDEIISQPFSDSQGCLKAREKSILKELVIQLRVPNVSLDVIKYDCPLMFVNQKLAIHVAKNKEGKLIFILLSPYVWLTNLFIL
jgi:hypothetical protein